MQSRHVVCIFILGITSLIFTACGNDQGQGGPAQKATDNVAKPSFDTVQSLVREFVKPRRPSRRGTAAAICGAPSQRYRAPHRSIRRRVSPSTALLTSPPEEPSARTGRPKATLVATSRSAGVII